MKHIVFGLLFASVCASPLAALAQSEVVSDTVTFHKARVLSVTDTQTSTIPGTDTRTREQTIRAEILEGARAGEIVEFVNDYVQLSEGDAFYARHTRDSTTEREWWSVADAYRLGVIAVLALAFLILTALFGGLQGIRGLAALAGSFVLIFWMLIPGILGGYSPVFVSLTVASVIVVVGSYVTHGFTRTTSAAVIGMIATVLLTGFAAYLTVQLSHFSGYTSEEIVYLNFDVQGGISMLGLLFAGIMIGLLGVLYDSAIGQAVAVEELYRAGERMGRGEVLRRGIRIGREHIGALVNTLAIAYVGASLPLLLLISHSSRAGVLFTLNSEIIATEIIRILIGSIGLILSVPITTLIAVHMLEHLRGVPAPESGSHSHGGHGHAH